MPNSAPNFGTCGSRRSDSIRPSSPSSSKCARQQRFADVEARVRGLFEHDDANARAGEEHRRRRPGGAAADDEHVGVQISDLRS